MKIIKTIETYPGGYGKEQICREAMETGSLGTKGKESLKARWKEQVENGKPVEKTRALMANEKSF